MNKQDSSRNLARHSASPNYFFGTIIKIVLIGLAISLMTQAFLKNKRLLQEDWLATQRLNGATVESCQILPAHGSMHIMEPAFMKQTDVLYAGLRIHNQHHYPMIIILSDSKHAKQYMAASIAADNDVRFSVPVGQYGMQVFFGTQWCNLETGFSDGATVTVEGGVTVQAGLTAILEFYGATVDPVQLALTHRTTQPVNPEKMSPWTEVMGDDKLELSQSHAGHYFSSGAVNGTPVVFMIDTGATNVTISSEVAMRAGIKRCASRMVTTANGDVDACFATVGEVAFGKYRLSDVDVTIMPDMPGDALLGMNVLRHFRIEQVDEKMTISTR